VPGQAVVAGAVLVTTHLVQRRSILFMIVVTALPPTPLMFCQSQILRQQMGEKESENTRWSV
jgi:hypothetical protein